MVMLTFVLLSTMDSSQINKVLLTAVEENDTVTVYNILSNGYRIADDEWTDYTLLITALEHKYIDMADLLLDMGCRVNREPKNYCCYTPLYYAVQFNDIELVKKMLVKKASIDDGQDSPFCLAVMRKQYAVIDWMLSIYNFEDINPVSEQVISHFLVACERNQIDIIKKFVSHGVSVNQHVNFSYSGFSSYTPLHFAVKYGSLELVEFLLDYNADVSLENIDGFTPLDLAIQAITVLPIEKHSNDLDKQNKNLENMIDALLRSLSYNYNATKDKKRKVSYFHIACTRNNSLAVKRFLQQGADINHCTPTDFYVYSGFNALHFAVIFDRPKIVEVLLDYGMNVNTKTKVGWTPLMLAAAYSKDNTVEILLRRGASVNETCTFSCFSFSISATTQFIGRLATQRYLESYINTGPNVKNISTLHLACMRNYTLLNNSTLKTQSLSKETLKYWIKNSDNPVEIVSLLLSFGANVNAKDSIHSTPLHYACGIQSFNEIDFYTNSEFSNPAVVEELFVKQTEIIDLLARKGADIDARQTDGKTSLHSILFLLDYDIYNQMLMCLLKTHCDVNAQDCWGVTPLHVASEKMNFIVIRELLRYGADINIKDNNSKTALCYLPVDLNCDYYLFDVFHTHLLKLHTLGFHVSKEVETSYKYIFSHYKSQFIIIDDTINNNGGFSAESSTELEKMKNIKLNKNITLFNILYKNTNEMTKLVENDTLKKVIMQRNFQTEFPIFGNLLELQFKRGLTRYNILRNAETSMNLISRFKLPNSCSKHILNYLDNHDLKNLNESAKIFIMSKRKFETDNIENFEPFLKRSCY